MMKVLPIIILVVLLGSIGLLTLVNKDGMPLANEGNLVIHVLDVGHGDCILIQTPDKRNILVDAGSPDSSADVMRYLAKHKVGRIDLLVITHPHIAHIGGIPKALQRFGVSRVLDAGWSDDCETYREVQEIIETRRIECRSPGETTQLNVGSEVSIEVLWPIDEVEPDENADNNSIVMRLEFQDVSLLLTGDIESSVEGEILARRQDFNSAILKVAKHGSSESTSNEFLQVVRPSFAVISASSDNPPDAETIRRLEASGAKIFRTDINGTIVFSTDGRRVDVYTEK